MGQNSHDQCIYRDIFSKKKERKKRCIYRDKIKTTLIVGGAKVYELLWGLTVFYLLSLFFSFIFSSTERGSNSRKTKFPQISYSHTDNLMFDINNKISVP